MKDLCDDARRVMLLILGLSSLLGFLEIRYRTPITEVAHDALMTLCVAQPNSRHWPPLILDFNEKHQLHRDFCNLSEDTQRHYVYVMPIKELADLRWALDKELTRDDYSEETTGIAEFFRQKVEKTERDDGSKNVPLDPKWAEAFERNLIDLADRASRLSRDDVTLGEVEMTPELEIQAAPLASKFNSQLVRPALPFALVASLLYLHSLGIALRKSSSEKLESPSLVFFHAGQPGFLLGSVWLATPSILIGMLAFDFDGWRFWGFLLLAAIAFGVATLTLRELWSARQKLAGAAG